MSASELLFQLVTLWVSVDPVGTVPLFLAVTKDLNAVNRRRAAIRATVISFCVLTGFLYLGQYLLDVLRIDLVSFQVAGGIVLFLFALSMIFADSSVNKAAAEAGHDVAVFPLAMPSIATPGAMLAVVVLTDNDRYTLGQQTITLGLLAVVLAATLILMLLANRVVDWIGQSGANVLSRVMGIILASVAVQMVFSALKPFLKSG